MMNIRKKLISSLLTYLKRLLKALKNQSQYFFLHPTQKSLDPKKHIWEPTPIKSKWILEVDSPEKLGVSSDLAAYADLVGYLVSHSNKGKLVKVTVAFNFSDEKVDSSGSAVLTNVRGSFLCGELTTQKDVSDTFFEIICFHIDSRIDQGRIIVGTTLYLQVLKSYH